jgi:hypothetical protein
VFLPGVVYSASLGIRARASTEEADDSGFRVVTEALGVLNHFIAQERIQNAMITAARLMFGPL